MYFRRNFIGVRRLSVRWNHPKTDRVSIAGHQPVRVRHNNPAARPPMHRRPADRRRRHRPPSTPADLFASCDHFHISSECRTSRRPPVDRPWAVRTSRILCCSPVPEVRVFAGELIFSCSVRRQGPNAVRCFVRFPNGLWQTVVGRDVLA